jgi:hypothetical protein
VEQVDKPSIGVLQVLGVVLEDKSTVSQEKDFTRLCYVLTVLNGRSVNAMVDSGVTHNFMKEDVARELGLQLEPGTDFFQSSELKSGKGGWHGQWSHLEAWRLEWNYKFHHCAYG